jgi:hypothetical protein
MLSYFYSGAELSGGKTGLLPPLLCVRPLTNLKTPSHILMAAVVKKRESAAEAMRMKGYCLGGLLSWMAQSKETMLSQLAQEMCYSVVFVCGPTINT